MTRLFSRAASLTLDTLKVDGFDIAFNVQLSDEPEQNTCEVAIYNLADDNRNALKKLKQVRTILEIGYGTDTFAVFNGELRQVNSTREGVDWVTRVSSGDGDEKLRGKRLYKSYASGTKVNSIIDDIGKVLGAGKDALAKLKEGNFREGMTEFKKGYNITGNVFKEFIELAKAKGYRVWMQDGEVKVLKIDQAFAGEAILLTPDTGLIGSPEVGTKIIKLRSLIIPDLTPGRKIEVRSEHVKGFFVVRRANYTGDRAGNDWNIDMEAAPL